MTTSLNKPEVGVEHVRFAAEDYFIEGYMGHVARVHATLRKKAIEQTSD